jgi:hypothetical protein
VAHKVLLIAKNFVAGKFFVIERVLNVNAADLNVYRCERWTGFVPKLLVFFQYRQDFCSGRAAAKDQFAFAGRRWTKELNDAQWTLHKSKAKWTCTMRIA